MSTKRRGGEGEAGGGVVKVKSGGEWLVWAHGKKGQSEVGGRGGGIGAEPTE